MKKILIALSILVSNTLFTQEGIANNSDTAPRVRISSGIVRGVEQDGVVSFKGIPYAAPPVGKFRWRTPQPVVPWQGELNASEFGTNAAQAGWPPRSSASIADGSSEDCLFLNLWLPAGIQQNAKLPVMVWVHGGGFVGGSGADRSSTGEEFAKQGVILMTFNYRLGRLGHFAFPALSAEYPNEPKGSYAYMDQIAALQWVRENIADFGKLLTLVTTDKVWAEPARFTAKAFASQGLPAYVYLFSYVPASMQERMPHGASHASEIPYVFNKLDARWGIETITSEDQNIARMMNSYWANFAKTGNPNGEGLPEWSLYDPQKNELLEFRADGSAVSIPDPKKARLDVIEKAGYSLDN